MSPFVVDANVMNYFQRERASQAGVAQAAIEAIFSKTWIVLDDAGHCQQEWLDCAEGSHPLALSDWINDQLVERRIRLSKLHERSMFKELSALGIPKKDHKWVRLSIGANAEALVTEDVDLIDPCHKKSKPHIKDRLKAKCNGYVAKALKKNYGVVIACCQHVPDICA